MKKIILLLICIWAITIQSCNKDDGDSISSFTSGGSISCSVAGKIIDESGAAIIGAVVHIGNRSYSTDNKGIFYMSGLNLDNERVVLKVTKNGYWDRTAALLVESGRTGFTKVVMSLKNFNNTVSGTSGGTIQSGNSLITFPANAFTTESGAAYTGQVHIAFKDLPTTDPNFNGLTPGTDLLGEDANGDQKLLISYGMVGAELQDASGNKVLLAPGKKATITFPIAADQLAAAPATIPLWHFSDDKNIWLEEGSATKQGNNYIGEVSHFTWWNCDWGNTVTLTKGQVKDCLGRPVPFTYVSADGDLSNFTDNTGHFMGYVSKNQSVAFASCNIDGTWGSPVSYNIGTSTATIPDLIVPCLNYGLIFGYTQSCVTGVYKDGILWVINDSSGKDFITPIYSSGLFVSNALLGSTHFKAMNASGEVAIGTATVTSYPDTTFINSISFCPPIFTISNNNYTLNFLNNGCSNGMDILDSLTEDTIAFNNNNSALIYLKDLDGNPNDTNISVNCLVDYQEGTQLLDTSTSNYVNIIITHNNQSIYLNSENGYVTFTNAGKNSGDQVDLSFNGICSLTNPQVGGSPCYIALSFRTRFIRK